MVVADIGRIDFGRACAGWPGSLKAPSAIMFVEELKTYSESIGKGGGGGGISGSWQRRPESVWRQCLGKRAPENDIISGPSEIAVLHDARKLASARNLPVE